MGKQQLMNKILLCSSREKWKPHLEAAAKGLSGFIDYECVYSDIKNNLHKEVDDIDLCIVVAWYVNNAGKALWKALRERGIPIVFLSDGLFLYKNKGSRTMHKYPFATFINGPQSAPWGDKHYRTDLPKDRLKRFMPEIKTIRWRKKGDSIIIAHQSGGTHEGESKQDAYDEILKAACDTGRPVIYRLHPNSSAKTKKYVKNKIIGYSNVSINKAPRGRGRMNLKCPHCLITYGGKSAAKAIIEGIPSITYDVTIAEMVAERDITNIEKPKKVDRKPWLNWLSYNHWTISEMKSGLMWKFFIDEGYLDIC